MQIARYVAALLWVLAAADLPLANGRVGQAGAERNEAAAVSVRALAETPEAYFGRRIEVSGQLENAGTNYFTDLRVVLEDSEGNAIYVTPWLPLEFPPSPPGVSRPRPPTLSDYLGKRVKLVAILEHTTFKGIGEVYSLRVKSAAIIP